MPFSFPKIFKTPTCHVISRKKIKSSTVINPLISFNPIKINIPSWFALLLLFCLAPATIQAKPPILLSKNSHWWETQTKPKPHQGWDTFTTQIKKIHPYIKQYVDEHGSVVCLINMRVTKKGRVDFAEMWDCNSIDSLLKDTLIQAIKYNGFTPYKSIKGKTLIENTLVMMEIPADFNQLETQPQDTTLPNKSISPARFLGGDDAFNKYVASAFRYPERCLESNISGYVRMRFMVDRRGIVTQCRIKEGTRNCPEFGIEAARILRACPKWIPATYNGQNISAWFEVPIALSVK